MRTPRRLSRLLAGVRRPVVLAALLLAAVTGRAEPVRVYPANPHYFMRDGRPLVLATSDHHYGAVID